MDPTLGTLIGVVIGALLTGFVTWLNTSSALKRDREERAEKRLEDKKIWGREQEAAQVRRIEEIYSNAAYSL
jgi:hypothetical protein